MSSSSYIEKALNALQKYWKYPNFRPLQEEVIQHLSGGHNVVALLPTGGGKSMCYQVPSLISEGLTLVISPLISLMEDQVTALKQLNIRAEAIHSGHTARTIDRILDNCIYGDVKLLYVSPERLNHEVFRTRSLRMNIDLIAIDEAHCISQWGHDFRPSYLQIKSFLDFAKPRQIIALTATATPRVLNEIINLVFQKRPMLVKGSFKRDNIAIRVVQAENKINQVLENAKGGVKTIVYVRSRRKVVMIAKTLVNHGFMASHYHAGLDYKEKKNIQERFKQNQLDIVVATNAFGMGIDVSNVRQVIHYDIPSSLEEYYQEIGRAGRDGTNSKALFLISKDDLNFFSNRVEQEFPSFEKSCKLYKAVHVYFKIGINEGEGVVKSIDYKKLSDAIGISINEILAALRLWQKVGVWELTSDSRDRVYCKFNIAPREIRQLKRDDSVEDDLLEYLMRNFENIFSNWVELDVDRISSRCKKVKSEILTELISYSKLKLLNTYILEAGQRLQFLQNRISKKDLDSFQPKYDFLKSLSLKRRDGMNRFLASKKCRMHEVLEYFGEHQDYECGICDSCLTPEIESDKDANLLELQRRINES